MVLEEVVLRRRNGVVERIKEGGIKRAEGEFADDMGEIERCGEKTQKSAVLVE